MSAVQNVALAKKLAALSPAQRALLEKKLKSSQKPAPPAPPPVVKVAHNGAYPLSLDQERLWFINTMAPGNAAYNINAGTRLRGSLDVAALERAINAVVSRHESLRATIRAEGGAPQQHITPDQHIALEPVDLTGIAPEHQDEAARQFSAAYAARPFDMERGPLVRYALMKLAPDHHIMVSTFHHIIMDWWSSQIIFDELTQHYDAYCDGRDPGAAPTPYQFSDFVGWERALNDSGALEPSLAYWKKKLAGGTFSLDLPFARPRPETPRFIGRRQWLDVPADLIEDLRVLCRAENVTMFTLLTAAYKTLLYRYTGQGDITMGGPLADRSQDEWDQVVGFMITMLIYHTELDGDLPFRDVLRRVRNTIVEAYTHKDAPFGALVEAGGGARDFTRNPLFQHSFIFLNLEQWRGGVDQRFGALDIEHIDYDPEVTRFDTTLTIWEMEKSFRAYIEYDSDLFDDADMARFVDHFILLLRSIVANPGQAIGALPMLTEAETTRITQDWNPGYSAYPRDKAIPSLFEDQAAQHREKTALRYHDATLSYAELEAQANQLARYIQARGVMPGARVGLCLPQSPAQIVATLAVLKAGAVYVPLNPDLPTERLCFIAEDAGATLIVTDGAHASLVQGAQVLLDREADSIAAQPQTPLTLSIAATDPACILYTSGSTGTPKGVVLPHRGAVRLTVGETYTNFCADDRVAQVANFGFDAAIYETWGALLNGGTLVQVDKDTLLDATRLAARLEAEGITVLMLTTSVFHHLAKADPTIFARLRVLQFGGEAASPQWVRAVLDHGCSGRIINGYGPTESTTYATAHRITDLPPDARAVPIGRPIENTTIYVMTPQGALVPSGVTGELCIGGDGLAQGYLNQPEVTAKAFVPDPFGPEGARLYRSGDLALFDDEGVLHFVGRLDDQVKIRGHRIEPQEIVFQITQHPRIKDAHVMVHEDTTRGRELVAYIIPKADADDTTDLAADLKRMLAETLPAAMVPAYIVEMSVFPLNTNGKIDQRALPPPQAGIIEAAGHSAPRTPTEESLATLWRRILAIETVGIDQDFFDLGGHSLLAIRLSSDIERVFGRRLPLAVLLQHATIAQLAAVLDAPETAQTDASPIVTLQASGTRTPLLFVPGAGGHPTYLRDLAHALGPDQPFYGLQAPGTEGDSPPLEDMADLVEFFLTVLDEAGFEAPYTLGGHSSGGMVAFALALALEARGDRVKGVVLLDVDAPGWIDAAHFEEAYADWSDLDSIGALVPHVQSVKYRLGERLPLSLDVLKTLGGETAIRYVTAAYIAAGLLPEGAGTDQIARMAAISSSAERAVESFSPVARLKTPALVCAAEDGEAFDPDRMVTGWESVCDGPVTLLRVPGNHLTMTAPPYVTALAAALCEQLGTP